MKEKLLIIYIPVLWISLVLLCTYSVLHWLFIFKLQLFTLNFKLLILGFPIIISTLIAYFGFRARVEILSIAKSNSRALQRFQLIVMLFLFVPLAVSQSWLSSAAGKLTALSNVDMMREAPRTKYYDFKELHFDTGHIPEYHKIVRKERYIDLELHFLVPLLSFEDASHTSGVWLAIHRSKNVRAGSNEQNNAHFQEFLKKTRKELLSGEYFEYSYFERLVKDSRSKEWRRALEKSGVSNLDSQQFLKAYTGTFSERTEGKLEIFLACYFGLALLLYIVLAYLKLDETAVKAFYEGKIEDPYKDIVDFLIYRTTFVITPTLIYLNIGVFLVMQYYELGFTAIDADDLVQWGGNLGTLSLSGDWWRLFTALFLHSGFHHLMGNIYGLLFAGAMLEPLFCNYRLVVVYLFGGLAGSIVSALHHGTVVSVGASGAILGLYGATLVLALRRVLPIKGSENQYFLIFALLFIAMNLIPGFFEYGIDNAGHLGGLIGGMFIAFFLSFNLPVEKHGLKTRT